MTNRGSISGAAMLPTIDTDVQYGVPAPGVAEHVYDVAHRERTNLRLAPYRVAIRDARGAVDALSLERNGFELRRHTSAVAWKAGTEIAAGDVTELRRAYDAEVLPFIAELSGTPLVVPHPNGFFVRHGQGSAVRTAARPARMAHCDLTRETATEMAARLADEHSIGTYSDFAVYQTWRAVSPAPQDSLLTFCDGSTVDDDDWYVVKSVLGPEDDPNNVYLMRIGTYSPDHRWYFFSGLRADEVVVFQGYDTRCPMSVLHTSFDYGSSVAGATYRVSIESRYFAFFPCGDEGQTR